MDGRPLAFFALFVLVFTPAAIFAGTFVYDDFSGATLDTSKWTLECVEPCNAEVYVDQTKGVLHIAQPQAQTDPEGGMVGEIIRLIGYELKAGDVLEWDFLYNQSSFRNLVVFAYGGNPNTFIEIGTGWDWQEARDGRLNGNYHFKLKILDELNIEIIMEKPNGEVFYKNRSYGEGQNTPFTIFAVTGEDGTYFLEFDNFIITTPDVPVCNCTNTTKELNMLKERVSDLEKEVKDLKNETEQLRERDNFLQGAVDALTARLDLLEISTDKILGYLSNLLLPLKKEMVCGYMKDNNLSQHTALDLSCKIARNRCSCSIV